MLDEFWILIFWLLIRIVNGLLVVLLVLIRFMRVLVKVRIIVVFDSKVEMGVIGGVLLF